MAQERILQRELDVEMKASYLDYAMSVLVGRALPDARDGLKPVHRRILYAMRDLGLLHGKPFRKSARVVGDVLGKYHPHGDLAVYDALVRMAQDFSLRYPLVQGQGNFGSVDGDNPAAMRYTESRLTRVAEELLEDLDKETVPFTSNFDASLEEPVVLPGKLPNLLVNGSSGIAVGMATSIPPHNLGEVTQTVITLLDTPDAGFEELIASLQGPDFPTGGIILGRAGILQAYRTGRGTVRVRGRAQFEERKERQRIIITELPFQVNKALLVEEIAVLVREKKIIGIADLRDESDRDGMRVVIELKRDANRDVVLNQLFSHSRLESTFGIMLVALVDNQPRMLSLAEIITQFIHHRILVVRRRTQFDLKKATERAHIIEGLIVALDNIDAVIAHIRAASDVAAAKKMLLDKFPLTEVQVQAILDMRLQKLASLERQKIRDEHTQLLTAIAGLKETLASDKKIRDIIRQELVELRQKYGDARRTEIVDVDDVVTDEDLIPPEETVVTITHLGYVKRLPLAEYRQQHRGGRGITATGMRDEDFVERMFVANTHSTVLFFTNRGMVHWLKVYQLPEGSRHARGKALVNMLQLRDDEHVTAAIPVREFDKGGNLVMATRNGTIKKTALAAYARPRKGGIIAITLETNDALINVALTSGREHVILASRNGLAVRFNESDIRSTGRSAKGVRGMRLRDADAVVGMVVADESKTLLTVTAHGYGKRTPTADYRLINRGGAGVINIQTSTRNGPVVAISSVTENDELMFISRNGIMIRVPASDISVIGRNTQGARVMRLDDADTLVACAKVVSETTPDLL